MPLADLTFSEGGSSDEEYDPLKEHIVSDLIYCQQRYFGSNPCGFSLTLSILDH